jgi:hypothetical protein
MPIRATGPAAIIAMLLPATASLPVVPAISVTALPVTLAISVATLPVTLAVLPQVLVVAMDRLLSLANGIGARLDRWRVVVLGLTILVLLKLIGLSTILLLTVLLLMALLEITRLSTFVLMFVATALPLAAVGLAVILFLRRTVLRLPTALATTLATTVLVSGPMLPAPLLLLIVFGQSLSADTQTEQTDTCQTPDARLHAFPHGVRAYT